MAKKCGKNFSHKKKNNIDHQMSNIVHQTFKIWSHLNKNNNTKIVACILNFNSFTKYFEYLVHKVWDFGGQNWFLVHEILGAEKMLRQILDDPSGTKYIIENNYFIYIYLPNIYVNCVLTRRHTNCVLL